MFDVDCSIPLFRIEHVRESAPECVLFRFLFETDAVTIGCGASFCEGEVLRHRFSARDLWGNARVDTGVFFRVSCPYEAYVSCDVLDGFISGWQDAVSKAGNIDALYSMSIHCLRFCCDKQRNAHFMLHDTATSAVMI